MAENTDQYCIISLMFPVTDDSFALGVKAKIQEMLINVPDAKIDFALRSGASHGPRPTNVPGPVR